ncbi:MAG: hypothetical protein JWP84_1765, partial [Tardiphaga sp.]|nr:hypothetical protein [Tardiphaga sp.]
MLKHCLAALMIVATFGLGSARAQD